MIKDQLRKQILTLVEEYGKLHFQPIDFLPGSTVIPASGKVLGEKELMNLVDASLDGWLTTGRFNEEFEKNH